MHQIFKFNKKKVLISTIYIQLNGYLTEDENMADSIGIQIAYSTYKKIAKQKPQTKLPGLENITNDELFFLSFANVSYLIKYWNNFEISTI